MPLQSPDFLFCEVSESFANFKQMHIDVVGNVAAVLGIDERSKHIARHDALDTGLFQRFEGCRGARGFSQLYVSFGNSPVTVPAARRGHQR